MRIISVTNQKGGCGKTTTAVNLSACLAANGKKVLLIDLDPQAHATLGLNIRAEASIYNVLSKISVKKTPLEGIIRKVTPGFDIAPSSIVLSTLEQELAGEIGRESRLWEVLQENKQLTRYDYLIIDLPPNLGILTVNAIRASSEIIIPVEASRFSLEGVNQLLKIIELIKDRLNHNVSYKILVTNFDSRLRHSFSMLDQIKESFKGNVFGTIIHVNVKLKEAQSYGTHILSYDKYSRGAKDYFTLSREMISGSVKNETAADNKMASLDKRMKESISENMPRLKEVVFSMSFPEAQEVHVAGDFNRWQISDNSRMSKNNGKWFKKMTLEPGAYHYRFVVDGTWMDDPENPRKETNPFGQTNSLLNIK
ncbi:MAG: AAA family ATPase [Candidatus Omnitrophota bacterium]|jgi:chromosome partitioning protein